MWTKRQWNGRGTPVQCCVNCGFMKWTVRAGFVGKGKARTQYIESRNGEPAHIVGYRPCDGHGPPAGLAIRNALARHGVELSVQYYADNRVDEMHVRLDVPASQVGWLQDLIAGRLERR